MEQTHKLPAYSVSPRSLLGEQVGLAVFKKNNMKKNIFSNSVTFIKKFLGNKWRLLGVVLIILALVFGGWKIFGQQSNKPQYQTAQAEKGTLVSSITASGTISTGNSVNITTQASGVIANVYVKSGDSVTQGQKIADITLNLASQQKQAAAWSSYLSAKNNLDAANAKINSLQAAEFKANQTFINDAVARGLATNDPTYIQENALWLQAEADYKNQQGVIIQTRAALSSAWLSYSQPSSIISAPISGVITNLNLTSGLPITAQTSSTGNEVSQTLGTITLEQGSLQAVVNLSEIDVPKINPGQKVTLTLDAFPGKTYTGKVATINTTGVVSSGVTTYPTTITLDTTENRIYPNMAVSATIITDVKNNALLIPSTAVQNSNGQSSVRVMRNGQVSLVPVEIGTSNDTQTEITSGINEGDIVVTGQTGGTTNRTGTQGGTSPFGAFGGGRGGFGGGGGFRGGGAGGGDAH